MLDNCEHLLDDVAGLVARILTEATETAVLVTSRERLGVAGERPVQLGPLPLGAEAEQLFRDRAALVAPELADDGELAQKVCAELDGVPLAIELAAARAGSLGPDGLLAALDDRLRLLSGGRGPNERHNSLAQVIGWSYDLLGEDERRLFRRLGVFVGGFDLAAVAGVTPGRSRGELSDLLGRLTDKSLLHRSQRAGVSRWRMLETVRVFALEELKDEYDEVAELHVAWADQLATKLERQLEAGEEWQEEFDLLAPDLRVASSGVRSLARKLAHLTFARRRFLEAREHYLVAAAHAADAGERYDDLRDAADAAMVVADGGHAYQLMMRSAADGTLDAAGYAVTILNRYEMTRPAVLPEDRGASLLPDDADDSVLVRVARAWVDRFGIASAEDAVAVARQAKQPLDLMSALDAYSTAVAAAGRLREADAASKERMSLAATLPEHDPRAAAEIVDAFHVASTTAIAVGDLVEAVRLAQLIDDPVHGHPYITAPRKVRAYALTGRFEDAVQAADVMWKGWRAAGCPPRVWMASAAAAAALAHGLLGSGQDAVWQARAVEIARGAGSTDDPGLAAPAAFVEARLAIHHHDTAPTAPTGVASGDVSVVERAFGVFREPWWIPYAHAAGAELAVVSGHPDAVRYLEQAVSENAWAQAVLRRAEGRLTGDRGALLEAAGMFRRIGARFEEECTLSLAR